jgi:hypothetical protein
MVSLQSFRVHSTCGILEEAKQDIVLNFATITSFLKHVLEIPHVCGVWVMSADYHFSSCLWWGPRYASVSLYPEGPLFPVVPCNQPHYQAAGPTMALPFK